MTKSLTWLTCSEPNIAAMNALQTFDTDKHPSAQNVLARPAVVRVNDLEVTYGSNVRALQRTSLDVCEGEFLVLLGPSGAGKSTLLRALNGLVTPTAGEVTLPCGARLTQGNALREHRRRTGMVFQQHHLIGRQTVLANVLMGRLGWHSSLATLGPWGKQDRELALSAIERVGLIDKALARADVLSGGQQQRVGIARALVQQPRLLLADEPVASLDPATAVSVLTLLHAICKKDGLAAVVSLHQVDLARRFADRVIGLNHGSLKFDCPVELLDEPGRIDSLYASDLKEVTFQSPPTHVPGAALLTPRRSIA